MIPKHKVDEILMTAQIEDVIADFVNIKKSGRQYKGLSPFANEKTPSFYVVPEKQIFKDFSSGKGGNVVSFLMEHEHFTFPEALRFLAKRYNIELEEEEQTDEQKQAESERESLYIVTEYAQKHFSENLHDSDEGKSIGLGYFKERGFTEETIDKFKLGYAKNDWEYFYKTAIDSGYQEQFLESSGLIKKSPKGDRKFYDGFKGRVIFPIHNLSGRPLGFGARTLLTDKKVPKYLNSPESLIYNKSAVLYGIYFAKGEIIKEDNCYLVEGYTDVIQLYQSGIKNVVSSSGTALTQGQIKLIKRYTNNITLLYDGDAAGIRASFRGIDMILEEGMNVKMVTFPEGEDPDSFAKSNYLEDIQSYLNDNAKDFIVTKTSLLLSDTGNDPIKRASLIKDIVSTIALIPEEISRSVYIKECSTLLDVPEKVLINELNKIRRKNHAYKNKGFGPPPEMPPDEVGYNFEGDQQDKTVEFGDNIDAQEKDLLRILLNYGDKNISLLNEQNEEVEVNVAQFIVHEIQRDEMEFSKPEFATLLEKIEAMLGEDNWDLSEIINHSDPNVSSITADLLASRYELHKWDSHQIVVPSEQDKLKRAVEGSMYAFKLKNVAKMKAENRQELKIAQEAKDDSKMMELLKNQITLDQIVASLSKPSGRIIIN